MDVLQGEDFVGGSNESAFNRGTYSGSFEPLNAVHSQKKCLSCNQVLSSNNDTRLTLIDT